MAKNNSKIAIFISIQAVQYSLHSADISWLLTITALLKQGTLEGYRLRNINLPVTVQSLDKKLSHILDMLHQPFRRSLNLTGSVSICSYSLHGIIYVSMVNNCNKRAEYSNCVNPV